MLHKASFDQAASTYDADFTHSLIGKMQRQRVRHFLKKYLPRNRPLRILEINCGTGEDALWLAAQGHYVLATDVSPAMIQVATAKLKDRSGILPEFRVSGFDDLETTCGELKFDLVFSNFSGLNCIDAHALKKLESDLAALLVPNGMLVAVLFGKYCWIERLETWLKGKNVGLRRLQPATAKVSNNQVQKVFYYAYAEIAKIFSHFKLIDKKAVGLFIPPSYMERRMKRIYLPLLQILEKTLSPFSVFADNGDHILIVMQRTQQ